MPPFSRWSKATSSTRAGCRPSPTDPSSSTTPGAASLSRRPSSGSVEAFRDSAFRLTVFSIFSDRRFLVLESTPHAVIMSPFWGTNPETPPDTGRFERYADVGGSFLRLAALLDCEVGVFPQNWETAGERATELGEEFAALCRAARKEP